MEYLVSRTKKQNGGAVAGREQILLQLNML